MLIQVKIMKTSKALSLLLSLAIAVFFFSASLAVPMLCRPYYYSQARSLNLPEQTGFDEETIFKAYDDVMDYLIFNAEFSTGPLKWSESGKNHFEDCKRLFRLDFVLAAVSAAVIMTLVILKRREHASFYRFAGRSPAFWSALGLTIIFGIFGVWAAFDFNSLFTAFHKVFFPGKTNWIFDWRTDEIILILPEAFWARTGALVLGLCLGGSITTAFIYEKTTSPARQS